MIQKFCSCSYKYAIDLVQTNQKIDKKLFCRGCAWDDPNKDSIKSFKELEDLITQQSVFICHRDSDMERIQNISSYQNIFEILDQIKEITKKELCLAVEKRCLALKTSLQKQVNPLNRIFEAIKSVSKKQYTTDTVEFLVKELDCNTFSQQLNKLEIKSYQQNKLVCEEIINLADVLQKVIKTCNQEQKVGQLGKISESIQQKLDFKLKEDNKYYISKFISPQNSKRISITEVSDIGIDFQRECEQTKQLFAPTSQKVPSQKEQFQPSTQMKQLLQQKDQPFLRQRVNTEYYIFKKDIDIKQIQESPEKKRTHMKTQTSCADVFPNTERQKISQNQEQKVSNNAEKNQHLQKSINRSETPKNLYASSKI